VAAEGGPGERDDCDIEVRAACCLCGAAGIVVSHMSLRLIIHFGKTGVLSTLTS
jgi:hypothetical protein